MMPRPQQIRWLCGKHFQIGIVCVVSFILFLVSAYHSNFIKAKLKGLENIALQWPQTRFSLETTRHYNISNYAAEKDPQRERTNETKPEVFAHRLKRVKQVCAANPELEGKVRGMYTHPSGVIYCFVPKAGCTFWKRIFNFASRHTNDTQLTPWDIPRYRVHHNAQRKGSEYDSEKHSSANYPMRVLVSRNPFTRIVSSYLDKFYLPDFWENMGRKFIKRASKWSKMLKPNFMTRHFDVIASLFETNATSTRNCGKRMTFPEFVQSVLNFPEAHWMPIHKMCNPCSFQPTHIIHMESFSSDSRVVLKRMGLERFLNGLTHDKQIDEEIRNIVDYNFYRLLDQKTRGYNRKCLTSKELAYRLWHNFRWRGYIHPDVNYVIPDNSVWDVKKDLLDQLWTARREGLRDKAAMKQTSLKFQRALYSTLDVHLYDDLRNAFKMDFMFFEYRDSLRSS